MFQNRPNVVLAIGCNDGHMRSVMSQDGPKWSTIETPRTLNDKEMFFFFCTYGLFLGDH